MVKMPIVRMPAKLARPAIATRIHRVTFWPCGGARSFAVIRGGGGWGRVEVAAGVVGVVAAEAFGVSSDPLGEPGLSVCRGLGVGEPGSHGFVLIGGQEPVAQ